MKRKYKQKSASELISTAELVELVGVEEEARVLAVSGRPEADEGELSASEQRAVEMIGGRVRERAVELWDEEMAIAALLEEAPGLDEEAEERRLGARVVDQVMSTVRPIEGAIRDRVVGARRVEAEYNAFVERNRLGERSAVYPVSRVWYLAMLLVLWMVHGAIDAVMYLEASPAGVVGALMTALAVSGVTVGLGLLTGLVWRYVNLPDLPPEFPNRRRNNRLWSVPVIGLTVMAIGFVNIFAGHWREVAASSDAFAERLVLDHLIASPLTLSVASWALVLAGMLTGVISAWKGIGLTDRCPGFESTDRRRRQGVAGRDDLRAAIQGGMQGVRLTEIDGAARRVAAVKGMPKDLRRRFAALERKRQKWAMLDESDREAGAAAVKRFRALNLTVRTDGVRPGYFAETVEFGRLDEGDRDMGLGERIEAKLVEVEAQGRAVEKVIEGQRRNVEMVIDQTDALMEAIARREVKESEAANLGELRHLLTEAVVGRPKADERKLSTAEQRAVEMIGGDGR